MLVVKIELWPHGIASEAIEIGRGYIANDATGVHDSGNYEVLLTANERGNHPPFYPEEFRGKKKRVARAKVVGFPRLELGAWDLLLAGLGAASDRIDKFSWEHMFEDTGSRSEKSRKLRS